MSWTRAQVQEAAARVCRAVGASVQLDAPLAPHLSMRIGGLAAALLVPPDAATLVRLVQDLHAADVPLQLLGGGSNLVAADAGLDFAVVHVGAVPARTEWDGATVRASGGTPLGTLLREAMQRGMSGLEWAAGLPGSVGGAVAGNAGAFGGEIGASVLELTVMTPGGDVRAHRPAPGEFAYRASFLAPGEIVLEVVLALVAADPDVVRQRTDRVNRTRAASQPKGGHSSGCIFKNPQGASAGKLIDECGLKGRRRGGAFVSPSHGNFIINDGTATSADVLGLIEEVRDAVLVQSGVDLELEVKVWPEAAAPRRRPAVARASERER